MDSVTTILHTIENLEYYPHGKKKNTENLLAEPRIHYIRKTT